MKEVMTELFIHMHVDDVWTFYGKKARREKKRTKSKIQWRRKQVNIFKANYLKNKNVQDQH